MAKDLTYYTPQYWANEALIQLEKALGMASRVYRGLDEERRSFGRGEVINIRRPSTFTVENAPSTAQDVETSGVQVTLNQWKEVKFKLTDKDLSMTGERIIAEHIRPAAYAIADDIDQKLASLYADVPWFYDLAGTTEVKDVIGPRKVLFNNAVPMNDLHYMINGDLEANLLALSAFSQHQGAGPLGAETQLRGSLGTRYGVEIFANQNTPSHTPGVSADATGALTANAAKGDTSIAIDSVTSGGTFTKGDTLVIAGNTQRYSITANVTATGGAATLQITPPLVQAHTSTQVVTIRLDSHVANLMFHRNAFVLAMAPLSDMGKNLGAQIATVQDPITGLALRSRLYYVGDESEVHVALDCLYGYRTLDPNLAVRGCG
jgi:hypothetical protein